MIRFVSVDLETTGLDPKQDQILEVAAVTDDGETLHRIVHWDRVSGHPKAMLMNARLMEAVMDPTRSLSLADVISDLRKWLERWSGRSPAKVTGAGKNFASFDLQFLLAAGIGGQTFRHRSLDPASWFAVPEDEVLPDLATCAERAGIVDPADPKGRRIHEAYSDAETVRLLVEVARKRGLFNG